MLGLYAYVGMANNASSTYDYTRHEVDIVAKKMKINSIILMSLVLCLVLLVALLCVFLYKYKKAQRKKSGDKEAGLVKLFEPDEELEEELSGSNGTNKLIL